tara:strand:- start:1218 stop:2114 length:897 start_codon:yes stop_codon:yes gene_type:complete
MASIDELLNMQMQGLMQTRQQPNAFSLLGQALAQASSPNVTGSTFQRIGMVPGLLAQNMAEVRKQELAERRDQIELLRLQRQFQDEEAQRMQRQQLNANIQSLFSNNPLAQLAAQRGDIETALKLSGRLQPSRAEQLEEMRAEAEIQKLKDAPRLAREKKISEIQDSTNKAMSTIALIKRLEKFIDTEGFDTAFGGGIPELAGSLFARQRRADAAGALRAVQSAVVKSAIEDLRKGSAAGATGLGALSEKELGILVSSAGALDQTSSDQEILDTVTGLKDGLLGLIKLNQKALNELGL